MPAPDVQPKIPPFRCSQHIAFPIGNMQHVVVDGSEVLHVGPGLEVPKGIYTHPGIAVAVAEALAERLTAPKSVAA